MTNVVASNAQRLQVDRILVLYSHLDRFQMCVHAHINAYKEMLATANTLELINTEIPYLQQCREQPFHSLVLSSQSHC